MNHHSENEAKIIILAGILLSSLLLIVVAVEVALSSPWDDPAVSMTTTSADTPEISETSLANEFETPTRLPPLPVKIATPTPSRPTAAPTQTPTPTSTATPTQTSTPTPTPTPTLNLAACNAAGCGSAAILLPTAQYTPDLFLIEKKPTRRVCPECPRNEQLSDADLNRLIAADPATLARLREIALSQEVYEIAPGIVYIVYHNVHHIVIDLKESGFTLRNIIPDTSKRGTLITPSYCLSSKSLLVTTADYHGLNGSNKTETGQDLFFHLGRAALYERNGRYNIGVIRTRAAYDQTSVSWGGGPIFMWDGQYNYNPEQEWFDWKNLEHYRTTLWSKVTVAISKDRKYLLVSISYGLKLSEHAQNIIDLGRKWGIEMDRAMRFDGSESAYLAIRLGKYMVPILNLEEPLIVNCFAVESK